MTKNLKKYMEDIRARKKDNHFEEQLDWLLSLPRYEQLALLKELHEDLIQIPDDVDVKEDVKVTTDEVLQNPTFWFIKLTTNVLVTLLLFITIGILLFIYILDSDIEIKGILDVVKILFGL